MFLPESREIILQCLRVLLRPLVRFCLKNGVSIQDFYEYAKITFLEAAQSDLCKENAKITVSRLSVVTGLRRREVSRLLKEDPIPRSNSSNFARVVTRWLIDPKFQQDGNPRRLSYEKEDNELAQLVATISQDVGYQVVLAELEKRKIVKRTEAGLELLAQGYTPKGEILEAYKMISKDASDLIEAATFNIIEDPNIPLLHATTEYSAIPTSQIDTVKKWLLEKGGQFHKEVRAYLSSHSEDTDSNIDSNEENVRVSVGTFCNVTPSEDVEE